MLRKLLEMARDTMSFRATYDPTYPPGTVPTNREAKDIAAIDSAMERKP